MYENDWQRYESLINKEALKYVEETMQNQFKHKENGKVYTVKKIVNGYGIDIVFYTCDGDNRRYCRDLYMFLSNMELITKSK